MLESMAVKADFLPDDNSTLSTLLILLPALFASSADIIGARLEAHAKEEKSEKEREKKNKKDD